MYLRPGASKITQWDLDHMSSDHLADMMVELMGSEEANAVAEHVLKQRKTCHDNDDNQQLA
jgi:hypothetical protein